MTSNTTANTAPTVFQNNVNTLPGSNYLINLNSLPQDLLSNIANFIQKSSCSSTQSPPAGAINSNTVFSTIPSSTVLSTATNSTVLSGTSNNSTVLNSIIAPHASTLKEVMSIDPATGQPLSSYASAVLSTFLQAAATQAAAIQPSVSQPAFSQPAFSQPAVSGSGSSPPKRTGVIVIAPEEDNSESDCPASDREDNIDDVDAPVVPVSCFMKQTTFQQPESRDITPINITPFGNYTPVPGNSHQPGPTTFSCQSSIINIYQPPTVGSNGENQQQSAINNTYQPAAGTTFSCDSSVINIYQPKPGETGSSVINNNLPVGIPGSGMRTPPGSMINNYDRTTTVNSYQSSVISSSINSTPPNPVYNSSIYSTGHTNPIVIQPIGDPISEEEQTTVEDFEFQGVVVSPDDNDRGLTTLSGLAKFSNARDITLPLSKKKESGTHRKAVLPKAAAATCQSYIVPYSNIETCCIFCPPHFPKVIGNQLVKHLYEKHRCMKCQRMFKSDMYGNINCDTHYCVDATATDMVDCFICGRRHVLTDLFPCIGTHLRAKIHLKCQLSNCFRIFEGKADFIKHAQEVRTLLMLLTMFESTI